MKQEKLFTALADVGDDLLDMAQNKRFVNPWKRWGRIAACLAVVIALGVVLFFVLRDSGEKEPEVPDIPPVEEPTPEPEPAPNPPEEPEQTIFSQGEVTDGVWNLILVNPWNPMPENYSVELEEISGGGVDKRC